MIEKTGRLANMIGFANDLVKNNMPIWSGLTHCIKKGNDFQFYSGYVKHLTLKTMLDLCFLPTSQERLEYGWLMC